MNADTLFSSKTGIHYTPADIINRAKWVLGGIELDPASDHIANQTINAERFFADKFGSTAVADMADPNFDGFDGLYQSWTARTVWLNPPFTTTSRNSDGSIRLNGKNEPIRERVIGQWVQRWRAAIHYPATVEAAILLVPARTDTDWFRPLFGLAMCFIAGRLKFSDSDNSAPFPTALIYSGPLVDRFYRVFEEIGECGSFRR